MTIIGYNVFGATNEIPSTLKKAEPLTIFKASPDLTNYKDVTHDWNLLKIMDEECPDREGGNETCDGGPFTEFTVRGYGGHIMEDEDTVSGDSDEYPDADVGTWWWNGNNNSIGLNNYEGDMNSGALEIRVREGFICKFAFAFEMRGDKSGDYSFIEELKEEGDNGSLDELGIPYTEVSKSNDASGNSKNVIRFETWLNGDNGDHISIDIDDDWDGTHNFYLQSIDGTIEINDSIDDETFVTLLEVWEKDDTNGGGGGDNDPNNCASAKRTVNTDGAKTCGGCIGGYTEDNNGNCVAEDEEGELDMTQMFMYGGAAIGGIVVLSLLTKMMK